MAAVMGMVCGGRGYGPFDQPHDGRQPRDAIKRSVPGKIRMGPGDHRKLDHDIARIDPAQTEIDQDTRQPDARHHRVVEEVIPVDEPHAHVARIVVRAVQIVEPRKGVRRAVPPVLHQIVEYQEQRDGGKDVQPGQRPCILRRDELCEGGGSEEDRRLGQAEQRDDADRFDDPVVAGLFGLRKQVRAPQFEQREAEIDGQDGKGRCGHGLSPEFFAFLSNPLLAFTRMQECPDLYIWR